MEKEKLGNTAREHSEAIRNATNTEEIWYNCMLNFIKLHLFRVKFPFQEAPLGPEGQC